MKKLFLFIGVCFITLSINAQQHLYQGTVFNITKERKTDWFVRVGMTMNNATGGDLKEVEEEYDASFGTNVGYDISVGFNRKMGSSGIYWGMEYGLGTRGYKASIKNDEDETSCKVLNHGVKISPFTLGFKYGFTDKLKVDAHLGAYVSCDFASSATDFNYDSFNYGDYFIEPYFDDVFFDAGIQAGIGIWYGRFNLDLIYQRGFMSDFVNVKYRDDYYYESYGASYENKFYSSNFTIRLGVSF